MRMPSILTAFLTTVVVLSTAGTTAADVRTIPLDAGNSSMQLVEERATELDFRVEVGELAALDVSTDEGEFTRLLIPGFHASHIEGEPELPMMNRLIALPLDATARVEIASVRTQRYSLAELGIVHPLMPAQPSLSKSQDPSQVPFVYNRSAYQQTEVSRDLVRVVEQGLLRALRFGRLEIAPLKYFPQSAEIEVVEHLEFTVRFEGADHAAQRDLYARTSSPFFDPVYAQIMGTRSFHDAYPDRVQDVVTYVIITPEMFVGQLQPFVDWKTARGFHVIVGVIGSPEVGTTTTSIRDYIHGLYNNATPEQPAPSFVVFVGDVAQCPTWSLSGDATDRPYCAVDGDLVPDIYYGRLSATNPDQLQAILDKTLMYDQYTLPDPSYLDEVVLIAGVDSYYAATHGNGQINYGTEHYFNAAHGILSHTYLYPASNGPVEAEIVGHVSHGVSFINYTAHGSTTSWSDPSFTQSNINSLTNDGKYCLAIGNCCLTSTYDYAECFAETWLRAANKGAIGYIGGSNSTYWDEDYWWGVGYHPSSQINGAARPYEDTGLGAYDGLFHDHGEADTQWYVTNDAIIFCGNLAVHESGSSHTTYYWNIYNLMGDPSLSTYLGVPDANPVVHPETVFIGLESITISAVHGSYVGLTQNGLLVGAGTVGETGNLEITYTELLEPAVPMQIVVMAQNRVPYIEEIQVLPPEGPYLIYEDVTVHDETGDADGALDYSEAVTMSITLENVGVESATGVTATMTSVDPGVAIEAMDMTFPDIAPDRVGVCVNPCPVQVAADVPDGSVVPFELHITADNGVWDTGFSLVVQAPVLTVQEVIVVDSSLGDGDGVAEAGETVDLIVNVMNEGHSASAALTGAIASDDLDLIITGPNASGAAAAVNEAVYLGPFSIEILPSCPEPSYLDFQLAIQDLTGYAVDLVFEVMVGGWYDDLEQNRGWTVGAAGDNATAGIWTRADPVGTVYNGHQIQPEDDYTVDPGALCFITGNGSIGGAAGENDVDGGKTTLLSPVFDLSGATSATVSYWRWYTNSWGNNPDQDWWDVEVTADGVNWVSLEHTQQTTAAWTQFTFELTTYITLTENVQIRFVASDISPGSLVEAGVDDFLLTVERPSATAVNDGNDLPTCLALGENFPNPFNPKTSIRFELPRSSTVELVIFDITGRKVTTLVSERLEAGRHELTWFGRDEQGRSVASGIYFYRLQTEEGSLTRKMTLVK